MQNPILMQKDLEKVGKPYHLEILLTAYSHNSNPRPANAAALLKQEDAATSAAGALDADSIGSDATAE